MRLWTVHPKYLDSQGLVALWRESLLALKVLQGKTRGYRHHPQLDRFRQTTSPVAYVAAYLRGVYEESVTRGYAFTASKIPRHRRPSGKIQETRGQLIFEWGHLMGKLKIRKPELYNELHAIRKPDQHPLFEIVSGPAKEGHT